MSSMYLDPNSIRLSGTLKIMKRNDEGVEEGIGDISTTGLLPVNHLPASMFNNLEVMVNGIMVSFISSPLSHYKVREMYIFTLTFEFNV